MNTIGLVLAHTKWNTLRAEWHFCDFFYVEEFPPNATILTWLDREEQLTTSVFSIVDQIETTLRFLFSNKKVCVQNATEFKKRSQCGSTEIFVRNFQIELGRDNVFVTRETAFKCCINQETEAIS